MNFNSRTYFKIYFSIFIVVILFAGIIFPAYIIRTKIDQNYIVGRSTINKLAKSSGTKKELANAIVKFVSESFETPNQPLPERELHQLLRDKEGFCDEQANVVLALCNYANIKGRLVFLNGSDSISHHAVAEIHLDKWYQVDPFYEINFKGSFLIPSISSIKSDLKLVKEFHFKNPPSNLNIYKNLFKSDYPEKIILYNDIEYSKNEKLYQRYIDYWLKIVGENIAKKLSYSLYINKFNNKHQKHK